MKIDHIHFYVEDAAQMRDWLIQKMGFQSGGQRITEHTHTELVGSGEIAFWLSAARQESSPVARYLSQHPAGVVDIAFVVDDLAAYVAKIDRLQLTTIPAQELVNSPAGQLVIQGWGDYYHTLLDKPSPQLSAVVMSDDVHLIDIDHVVLNVPKHQLRAAARWYQNLFDLQVQQSFEIQTNYSGLYSQALVDSTGLVQFNINEPSSPNSQIQTFLELQGGAGIQHIALRTSDIFPAVEQLRQRSLEFLPIPPSYYTNLQRRAQQYAHFPWDGEEWIRLAAAEILMDWPTQAAVAVLLQIFTQPIFTQPTFFFEIIERRGNVPGFGEGNFQALFQAIEQAERHRS
jgi:4-hydroxyphenylpyruvate dioxygenase